MSILSYWSKNMPLEDVTDYSSYWKHGGGGDVQKLLPNHRKRIIARELIPDKASVLDIGCGNCSLYDAFKFYGKDIEYVGYDMYDGLDEIGEKKGIEVHNKDILSETIDRKYDYICILNVLEHVPNSEDFVTKVRDKFTYKLYVSVPNVGSLRNRIRLGVFGKFPITGVYFHIKEHIRFWTLADFKVWTKQYGFKITNMWGTGRCVWLVKHFPGLFSENILYELELDGNDRKY